MLSKVCEERALKQVKGLIKDWKYMIQKIITNHSLPQLMSTPEDEAVGLQLSATHKMEVIVDILSQNYQFERDGNVIYETTGILSSMFVLERFLSHSNPQNIKFATERLEKIHERCDKLYEQIKEQVEEK